MASRAPIEPDCRVAGFIEHGGDWLGGARLAPCEDRMLVDSVADHLDLVEWIPVRTLHTTRRTAHRVRGGAHGRRALCDCPWRRCFTAELVAGSHGLCEQC